MLFNSEESAKVEIIFLNLWCKKKKAWEVLSVRVKSEYCSLNIYRPSKTWVYFVMLMKYADCCYESIK